MGIHSNFTLSFNFFESHIIVMVSKNLEYLISNPTNSSQNTRESSSENESSFDIPNIITYKEETVQIENSVSMNLDIIDLTLEHSVYI